MKDLTIQEVHTYQQLADKGIVPHMKCIVNSEDHLGYFPKLDDNNKVIFYCMTCNCKLIPGLELILTIRKLISIYNIQL